MNAMCRSCPCVDPSVANMRSEVYADREIPPSFNYALDRNDNSRDDNTLPNELSGNQFAGDLQ